MTRTDLKELAIRATYRADDSAAAFGQVVTISLSGHARAIISEHCADAESLTGRQYRNRESAIIEGIRQAARSCQNIKLAH